MLSIDDLKKLAEMQEKLLRISKNDNKVNLEKYKDIVRQIDEYYFSNLLSEIKKVSEHNQTLEEELQYLEQISSTYEQVLVEQVRFRNVCESYEDKSLELSDLSKIDKEYIDNRKNAISGYLINEKNIENSRTELDLLSGKLREEERKNNELKKRLLEFEEVLRNNFIKAEGRYLNELKIDYVSVISEYEKLGYNFKELLYNSDKVKEILDTVYNEVRDEDDKLKTAELCFNKIPSIESKNILEEISLDNIKAKYKLTMIKILELLCKNIDNYDMFLEKRKNLFDLIKYRLEYTKKLGVNVSIDPFGRTRVFDQIKVVEALEDNSKNIHKVRKNINDLNSHLEEMISMRENYKEEIKDIRDIIIEVEDENIELESKDNSEDNDEVISMNDIIISSIDMDDKTDNKELIDNEPKNDKEDKIILDNQVIKIEDVVKLNMDIVTQKTSQVIRRVNEMVNSVSINEKSRHIDIVPELVIEQTNVEDDTKVTETIIDEMIKEVDEEVRTAEETTKQTSPEEIIKLELVEESLPIFDVNPNTTNDEKSETDTSENKDAVDIKIDLNDHKEYDSSIFMTINPFEEAPLFTDRTDDNETFIEKEDIFIDNNDTKKNNEVQINDKQNDENISNVIDSGMDGLEERIIEDDINSEKDEFSIYNIIENNTKMPEIDMQSDLEQEMPDAFWTVQEEQENLNSEISEKEEDVILSFDEQVALLRDNKETKNKTKVLKIDNNVDIDNKVA